MLLFSLMFCSLCFALCVFAVLVCLGAFLVVLLASGSGGHVVLGLYVLSVFFLDFLTVFFGHLDHLISYMCAGSLCFFAELVLPFCVLSPRFFLAFVFG